jgi:Cytochrome P460
MRLALACATLAVIAVTFGLVETRSQDFASANPRYAGDTLVRPDGYREWIYLSSGLGMNYNASTMGPQLFTNVFVAPWAYREFVATGKWPEKSIFVVEERAAETRGSINRAGHFQTDLAGIGVEVKDSARFPDKWAYFGFGVGDKTAPRNPTPACWQCHEDNAAVEHSFVQFYPTLKPIAKKFGTYRQQAEDIPASH